MARMRVFIVFVMAITVGGVFAYATYNYVQNAPAKTVTMPTQKVIVAASDLRDRRRNPAGRPADHRLAGQRRAGRRVSRSERSDRPRPRAAGDPERADPADEAGVEGGGRRACRRRFRRACAPSRSASNEVIGVAGYVLPGTRVDVVATREPERVAASDVTSKVILTNVQVLAAGTKIDRETDKNKPVAVSVVTLLVNPEESERLTLAATEGKIQLALRNPLDRETPTTRGIRPGSLLGAAPIVVAERTQGATRRAARQAPKPEPVRGARAGDR